MTSDEKKIEAQAHATEAPPVARDERDATAITGAIQRLKQMRGMLGNMTSEELIAFKHEGRRF